MHKENQTVLSTEACDLDTPKETGLRRQERRQEIMIRLRAPPQLCSCFCVHPDLLTIRETGTHDDMCVYVSVFVRASACACVPPGVSS